MLLRMVMQLRYELGHRLSKLLIYNSISTIVVHIKRMNVHVMSLVSMFDLVIYVS